MRSLRYFGFILAAPVMAALVGCGGGGGTTSSTATGGSSSGTGSGTKAPPAGAAKAFEGKGWGSIKGKVIYDGTPPATVDLSAQPAVAAHKDIGHCKMGNMNDQAWVVKDGAVPNTLIVLEPPAGTYFAAPPADKKSYPEEVVVDQPFCAFEPRVVVLYPGYTDKATKKFVPSGQKFIVKNSATIGHNTKYTGDTVIGNGDTLTIEPKGQNEIVGEKIKIKPQKGPIGVQCDFHKWMSGTWFALDHPYAVVTKDDGTFEIKNVPAGSTLTLKVWHENANDQTTTVTIADGKETVVPDIKVKAK